MNFWKLMDNIHDIIRMKYCQKTNNEYFPILIQFRSKHSSHWATMNKLSHFKSTKQLILYFIYFHIIQYALILNLHYITKKVASMHFAPMNLLVKSPSSSFSHSYVSLSNKEGKIPKNDQSSSILSFYYHKQTNKSQNPRRKYEKCAIY